MPTTIKVQFDPTKCSDVAELEARQLVLGIRQNFYMDELVRGRDGVLNLLNCTEVHIDRTAARLAELKGEPAPFPLEALHYPNHPLNRPSA